MDGDDCLTIHSQNSGAIINGTATTMPDQPAACLNGTSIRTAAWFPRLSTWSEQYLAPFQYIHPALQHNVRHNSAIHCHLLGDLHQGPGCRPTAPQARHPHHHHLQPLQLSILLHPRWRCFGSVFDGHDVGDGVGGVWWEVLFFG